MAKSNTNDVMRRIRILIGRALYWSGLRKRNTGKPAIGSVPKVASVYNEIYNTEEGYDVLDTSNKPKLTYVLEYAKSIHGTILDAGCGRGNILAYLLDNQISAFGIEFSQACFEKYLKRLPAANSDIISWASGNLGTYAGCICTDVLEHIPFDQLDLTIQALSKMSPTVFFGIANHSSVHNGHELHVIREGIGWWVRTLGKHFSKISIIVPKEEDGVLRNHFNNEEFFFFVCSNSLSAESPQKPKPLP